MNKPDLIGSLDFLADVADQLPIHNPRPGPGPPMNRGRQATFLVVHAADVSFGPGLAAPAAKIRYTPPGR